MTGTPVQQRDDATLGPVPLCVTLDALVIGDPLADTVAAGLKRHPGIWLRLPFWLIRGRAAARAGIARWADPAGTEPYLDSALLETLGAARAEGRPVVLVAEDAELGRAVARQAAVFDDVVPAGTVLRERFGEGAFDVIGRSALPLPGARRYSRPALAETSKMRSLLRALRPHQWLKNVLVFLPVLAGQRLTDVTVVVQSALAFLAFSMVASSVYLVNDIVDLREDRRHPTKRRRPFASGALPLSVAPVAVLVLLAGAVTLTLSLPPLFGLVLGCYLLMTFAYSLRLKGAVLIDVITLAGLYTIRVIAGSAATAIDPSVWLIGFSMFFFLSLALVKRYAELQAVGGDEPTRRLPGRGYQPGDLPVLVSLGVATGCLSVLVLALYVISDEFASHYRYPLLIWMLCPLLLYWIGRAWLVVSRDEMHDDPLVWAVRDQLSRWVMAAAVLILIVAR